MAGPLFRAFTRLQDTLRVKLVAPLEKTRSTYTPTSKMGVVMQRITSRIGSLTPLLAPSVLFVPASGLIKPEVAFQGFWRRFLVEAQEQTHGEEARNSSAAPFRLTLSVSIGYPDSPTVDVGADTFGVADLKAEDARLIDALMMGGDLFTSPTSISGAATVELSGWSAAEDTVHQGRYLFELIEDF